MTSSKYTTAAYVVEESSLTAKLLPPEDEVAPIAEACVADKKNTLNVIPPGEASKHLASRRTIWCGVNWCVRFQLF